MKKLLIVLLLPVVAAAGFACWRGWLDFKKADPTDGTAAVAAAAAVNKDKPDAPVARSESGAVSSDVAQYLLTSTATDFHTHRPGPVRFRDVHVGYAKTPDGEKRYRLCGQFLPAQGAGQAEWTPFVTIKTSRYELYIGAQTAANRQDPSAIWDSAGDLSSSLQSRFDSLQ